MAKLIENIADIADNYQAFIIDLWGVIHDGSELYDYSIETLNYLKSKQKKILFLSNSPKRSIKSVISLKNMGIDENLYDYIVTSGEFFFKNVKKLTIGNKFFHLGPEENQDILDELELVKVDIRSADFILTTGLLNVKMGLGEESAILDIAKQNNLPMICINPDIIVITKEGKEYLCAGAVAKEYQDIGGKVSYVGKPYVNIYEYAYNLLKVEKSNIIAIGDSLKTDIKGANTFGIDNILITGGIHSKELKYLSIEKLFNQCNIFPNFYINFLK